ncbi:uncharacterized protein LOC127289535 [Leptopilina boulardi]|uniref:uncharacterized protein LOC127289535 n=1 Tax=Leptopilina boulardi TaxID=63433 RepID=UPI0021F5F56F|nr:uncharacterized protein LOC127289535 [Leptopilina boulardi]
MVRMSVQQFEELHELIRHRLEKRSWRQPLSTRLRLVITLNVLAHGDSLYTTSNYFRIGFSTAYSIIAEVCPIIWECLQPLYLKGNLVAEDWMVNAQGFRAKWDMPNCIGAMDGKEIEIKAPPNSGSLYFNYKKFHSFKLMAMCNAFCRFSWVDIGDYGSVSNVSAFQHTEFYRRLERNLTNLPNPTYLPHSNDISTYFIIGDGIFSLRPYIMVPYRRNRPLTRLQELFNYRLSHARQIIECAFGILTSRWKILQSKMCFKLETSIAIVQALVCLHNFIITRELAADEEFRLYFLERQMNHFSRQNRASENEGYIIDNEIPLNDRENVMGNDDIDENALRNLLTNYFVHH